MVALAVRFTLYWSNVWLPGNTLVCLQAQSTIEKRSDSVSCGLWCLCLNNLFNWKCVEACLRNLNFWQQKGINRACAAMTTHFEIVAWQNQSSTAIVSSLVKTPHASILSYILWWTRLFHWEEKNKKAHSRCVQTMHAQSRLTHNSLLKQ